MSNQKTTQLRRLGATEIALGDLIPVVDVSEVTSPTGETKYITTADFSTYVVSGGFIELAVPYQGLQSANGLAFSEVTPSSDNERCYGNIQALGNNYSIFVKGYVNSGFGSTTQNRMLFGVGVGVGAANSPGSGNSAYIGVYDLDLIAYVEDGSSNYVQLSYVGFFSTYTERAFTAGLTKDPSGNVTLYINGEPYASSSGATWSTSNTNVVLGNGRTDYAIDNIKCIIYEGHIFNSALSEYDVRNMFYGGIDTTTPSLIASYNSNALNAGPTQWLDSVGSNHLLLPLTNAKATNPGKRFILSFLNNGTSGYLGNGTARDVLPAKYVLTSCIVESSGKPLLSVGSSNIASYPSASGTGSFYDNRVALVSASYGVNPIGLLALGVGHADRSIYVNFSASAAPCTISFDGYIRN